MADNSPRLKEIIATDDLGIIATYPTTGNTKRLLFPKAIGESNKGQLAVICAVMAVTSPNGQTPVRYKVDTWRCFLVADLTIVGTSPNDAFDVSFSSDRPAPWTSKDLAHQGCVMAAEKFR